MRLAAKRDSVEREIITDLLNAGCKVAQLQRPVDLAVLSPAKRIYLLEVKDPSAKPDKRRKEQADFIAEWEIPVVRNSAEAMRAVGLSWTGTQYRETGFHVIKEYG